MDAETIASLVFGTAVLAFLWNLHRDMGYLSKDIGHVREALGKDISDLRDRVLRVEGMLAGASLKIGSDSASG